MNPRVKQILLVLSVILAVFDMVSDFILAVDYCVMDNPWWCGLTWAFIAVPGVLGLLLVCAYVCVSDDGDDHVTKSVMWKSWKGIEICFESGPQMILQLYIITLTEKDPSVTSGDIEVSKVLMYLKNAPFEKEIQ